MVIHVDVVGRPVRTHKCLKMTATFLLPLPACSIPTY